MNANAEILLVRNDGALILQQRDDKPGITNPGFISSFGGHIEEGETPLDAAWRELIEETNLRPLKDDLEYFATYQKTKEQHGEDWTVYYHILRNVDDRNLEVFEGQGFVVINGFKNASEYKLTKLLNEVLSDYYKLA